MALAHQVERKPSDHDIEQVVGTKVACRSTPKRALSQDGGDKRSPRYRRSGVCFPLWHPFPPRGQPRKADQPYADENRSPAVLCHQESGPKSADCRSALHSGNEDAVGEPAIVFGHMVRENFRACRNCHRLADAEHQPHHQQHHESMNNAGRHSRN